MARVTVAIPTFDRPGLLKQAIDSVLRQTYQDFEILVSDDGSNPETATVARSVADPRVFYRRTSGGLGVPRHFNDCVRATRSELFALLPDDDLYFPEYLARMVEALDANPTVGFAQVGFYAVDDEGRCIEEIQASRVAFAAQGEDALVWQLQTLRCNPVAMVYRRSAMLDVGLWREDKNYFDDWAFAVRVAYRRGLVFVPALLACARRHGLNLSAEMKQPGFDHVVRIVNQQADVFREAGTGTDRLLRMRAELSRECSHRSMIAAVRCVQDGDWASARQAIRLARSLNPLAVVDLGVIAFALKNARARKRDLARRLAARSKRPVLAL